MSPANVEYLKANNSFIDSTIVVVAPNSIQLFDIPPLDRMEVSKQYNLPPDVIFVV